MEILPFFFDFFLSLFLRIFIAFSPKTFTKFEISHFKLHRTIIKLNFKPRANKIKLKGIFPPCDNRVSQPSLKGKFL